MGDPTKWFELAQKHWHRPVALFAALVCLLSVLTAIIGILKPSPLIGVVIYGVGIVLVTLGWWWSNRLPRTPKGKVGFVVSIHAGEESERTKIKEDFVLTLHELLKQGTSGRSFRVITAPEYIAETIVDQDDAQALRIKCCAQFVIYGRVRLRNIAGSDEHVLHLEGLVAHKPIAQPISESLSREFTELLPRRVRFATENDVFSFAFSKRVTKYMPVREPRWHGV